MNAKASVVSVIIPAFNAEKTIEKCVDSVVSQTYGDLEVVVVDDGSKDGSFELIQKLAASGDRIKYYHKENGGVSSARNIGLEHARGEWILFLDSDDWLFPDAIESLVTKASSTQSKVAVGETIFTYDSSLVEDKLKNEVRVYNTTDDYKGGFGLGNMVTGRLFARDIIGKIRFSETLYILEDMAFNLTVLSDNDSFRYVYISNKIQQHNDTNPESLSSQYKSQDLLNIAEWFYCNQNHVKNGTIFIDKAIKNVIQYRFETKKLAKGSS